MKLVPMTLAEANEFILSFHRHNKPVVGHRFCIGLEHEDELVGVAIAGRPVARFKSKFVAEVTRNCTNEKAPKGAVSCLYAACWRAWRAMGGQRLVTYTLKTESGASLRGAGFKIIGEVKTRDNLWGSKSRQREWQPIFGQQKLRWEIAAAILMLFCSCTAPRYDYNGNGTRPGDKLERWAIHAVNHESYPEK